MFNNYKEISKYLNVLSFVSIFIILIIILYSGSTKGYEISIYEIYPPYFWFFVLIPFLSPFIIFLLYSKNNDEEYPFLALFSSLISVIIVLLIPFFRGYLFYGAGDIFTHLALVDTINNTGYIGSENPYPISHILTYILASFINISTETVSLILRPIFFIIYVLSMAVLAKSLKFNSTEYYLTILFSIVPVFGFWLTVEYIMPSTDSFFIFPLLMAILVKTRTSDKSLFYSILIVVFLIFVSFFHPEAPVFIFTSFVLIFLIFWSIKKMDIGNLSNDLLRKITITPALILAVTTFAWFSSTLMFSYSVHSAYNAFVLNLASTPLTSLEGGIKTELFDSMYLLIRSYGVPLFYLLIALLSSISMLKLHKKEFTSRSVLIYGFFFSMLIVSVVFLLQGTATGMHIYRSIKYPLVFATLIMAIYLSKFVLIHNKKKLWSIVSISLILLAFMVVPAFSIFNIYSSPDIRQYNYQPTNSDIVGMTFFFQNKDKKPVLETMNRGFAVRYSDYIEGYKTGYSNTSRKAYSPDILPPSHFGYVTGKSLGDFYNRSQYLLIYPPSKYYYQDVFYKYPNFLKYNKDDFVKLNEDKTVVEIYNNGDLEIMIIR